MEKNWKDNIYYGIPDTDLDGDVDYVDRLNWEERQRSLNERHTPDEDDDEWRDDIDEDDAEDLGIDPYDYDSADEYIEALEDAEFDMGLWGDELPDDDSYDEFGDAEDDDDDYDDDDDDYDDSDYDDDDDHDFSNAKSYGAPRVRVLTGDSDSWRRTAADGSAFGLYPEDFKTKQEYEETLYAVICESRGFANVRRTLSAQGSGRMQYRKNAAIKPKKAVADGSVFGLYPENFKTVEEYEEVLRAVMQTSRSGIHEHGAAAVQGSAEYIQYRRAVAADRLKKAAAGNSSDGKDVLDRCRFIVKSQAPAARYLTVEGRYLYAQAVKDHFKLPFDIPDEKDSVKTEFDDLLIPLAEDNIPNSLKIWEWCLDTFRPYMRYSDDWDDITSLMLLKLYDDYPDGFPQAIIEHMAASPAFIEKLLLNCSGRLWSVSDLTVGALASGYTETAKRIMECAFANPLAEIEDKVSCIEECIDKCIDDDGLELTELFRTYVFPVAVGEPDVRMKSRIAKWQKLMAEFIEHKEKTAKQYAYSRINAWRAKYRGSDVDPTRYSSEEAYLSAVNERKYGWRRYCQNRFGISPEAFETRGEYDLAVRAEYERERERREAERAPDPRDTTLYRFCKVSINYPDKPYYYYLPGAVELNVGDRVTVPFGSENTIKEAVVVAVGECYGGAFPCRIEKIKTVAGKQ